MALFCWFPTKLKQSALLGAALKQRVLMSTKNNTFGYKDESTSLHGQRNKAWSRRAWSRRAWSNRSWSSEA
jgi:hypothetical protein